MASEGMVQITQLLPPRDVLSLADFELLGFDSRDKLRRFLATHHVPVVVDGKTLRFARADFLAGLARGARVLPARALEKDKPAPATSDADAKRAELARAGLKLAGGTGRR